MQANANVRGAVLSAFVIAKANLHGGDLTNGMLDTVNLTGADMSDAVLVEALLIRAIFVDININGVDFTDSLLDGTQVKELCKKANGINSKTGVETRYSLGCK